MWLTCWNFIIHNLSVAELLQYEISRLGHWTAEKGNRQMEEKNLLDEYSGSFWREILICVVFSISFYVRYRRRLGANRRMRLLNAIDLE